MSVSRRTVLIGGLGAIAAGVAVGTMAAKKGPRILRTDATPPTGWRDPLR